MRKVGFPKKIVLQGLLLLAAVGPARGDEVRVEAEYLDRTAAIGEGETGAREELAQWCREMGFIREMLLELDKVPGSKPGDRVEPLACAASYEPDFGRTRAARDRLLNRARNRVLKMAKRAHRFNFHTDLDKERVQDYAFILNRYYDSMKGLFRIHKTELGILVLLFSSRSDYLAYFQQNADANVEHWSGFFLYTGDLSLLCFYDNRADEDEVFNTAKHECTHLLVRQCLRGAYMANWLNEGLACYFAGDGEDREGNYTAHCYLTVRHALRTRSALTLEDLMSTPYSDFTFRHYAFAWSWVCYLRAQEEHAKRFGKFFSRLGNLASEPESRDWKKEHWEEETNRLFREMIGRPAELQQPWAVFVEEDLEPSTPEQLFHCAVAGLDYAGGRLDMQPPLKPSQRYDLLCEGERWLREAEASGSETMKARCGVAIVRSLVARARSLDYDEREMTHAAAESRRILDRILGDPSRVEQHCDAADLIWDTLCLLQNAGRYENEEGTPTCRLVDRITEREATILEDMKEAGIKLDHDCYATRELALVRFQKQLAEHLVRESRYGFGTALDRDPSNRQAVLGWLNMALDFAPKEVERVFPYLLFHVELDPDDQMLAALGAAYAVLGKREYAWSLLERAYFLTPKKTLLKRYAKFIPGK
jgi:hypothetical protein